MERMNGKLVNFAGKDCRLANIVSLFYGYIIYCFVCIVNSIMMKNGFIIRFILIFLGFLCFGESVFYLIEWFRIERYVEFIGFFELGMMNVLWGNRLMYIKLV
jgi:hypothetical protein